MNGPEERGRKVDHVVELVRRLRLDEWSRTVPDKKISGIQERKRRSDTAASRYRTLDYGPLTMARLRRPCFDREETENFCSLCITRSAPLSSLRSISIVERTSQYLSPLLPLLMARKVDKDKGMTSHSGCPPRHLKIAEEISAQSNKPPVGGNCRSPIVPS